MKTTTKQQIKAEAKQIQDLNDFDFEILKAYNTEQAERARERLIKANQRARRIELN